MYLLFIQSMHTPYQQKLDSHPTSHRSGKKHQNTILVQRCLYIGATPGQSTTQKENTIEHRASHHQTTFHLLLTNKVHITTLHSHHISLNSFHLFVMFTSDRAGKCVLFQQEIKEILTFKPTQTLLDDDFIPHLPAPRNHIGKCMRALPKKTPPSSSPQRTHTKTLLHQC